MSLEHAVEAFGEGNILEICIALNMYGPKREKKNVSLLFNCRGFILPVTLAASFLFFRR